VRLVGFTIEIYHDAQTYERQILSTEEATNELNMNCIYAGCAARPLPTALLSPRSDDKPEAATAVVVAPDDGHENARNVLSCI